MKIEANGQSWKDLEYNRENDKQGIENDDAKWRVPNGQSSNIEIREVEGIDALWKPQLESSIRNDDEGRQNDGSRIVGESRAHRPQRTTSIE